MDDNIPARRPFYCSDYPNGPNTKQPIAHLPETFDLKPFRRPSGKPDFVPTYEYAKDPMVLFEPRAVQKYDCNFQPAFGNRDFPLFQPRYWKGGYYGNNTLLPTNPNYPETWAPSLEEIPVYPKVQSRISQMNNRQYGSGSCDCASACTHDIIYDKRMFNTTTFTQCCENLQ